MKRFAVFGSSLLLLGWIDVEIDAPIVVPEGGEAVLDAIAPDGAALAWELDGDALFDDGDQWSPLLSLRDRDGPSRAVVGLRAELDGDVGVRFVGIDIANVPPVIVSEPPSRARRGFPFEYRVRVAEAGPADVQGLVFEIEENVGPETLEIDADGVVRWTPEAAEIGTHLVRILVSDKDGGVAAQNFLLEVVDDTAPFAPNARPMPEPVDDNCFLDLQPVITVGNTEDPDGDPLTYFFEVSDDVLFEGTGTIASPPVPEGRQGFTSWMVSRRLEAGGWYYWRAWATDGIERGESVTSGLCIRPDAHPDRDPPPTEPGQGPIPHGPEVRYTCVAARAPAPGSAAVLVLVAPLVLFRRKR